MYDWCMHTCMLAFTQIIYKHTAPTNAYIIQFYVQKMTENSSSWGTGAANGKDDEWVHIAGVET